MVASVGTGPESHHCGIKVGMSGRYERQDPHIPVLLDSNPLICRHSRSRFKAGRDLESSRDLETVRSVGADLNLLQPPRL